MVKFITGKYQFTQEEYDRIEKVSDNLYELKTVPSKRNSYRFVESDREDVIKLINNRVPMTRIVAKYKSSMYMLGKFMKSQNIVRVATVVSKEDDKKAAENNENNEITA